MKKIANTTVQQSSIEGVVTISPVAETDGNTELMAFRVEDDSIQADETAYLLRSAKNRRRILESIAQLDRGEGLKLIQ